LATLFSLHSIYAVDGRAASETEFVHGTITATLAAFKLSLVAHSVQVMQNVSFPQQLLFLSASLLIGSYGQRSYSIGRLSSSDMRRDVQEIFRITPHHKQVMMFSATLAKDIRVTCKKFMTNVCVMTVIPESF
jgi:hypothetical protein